MDHIEVILRKMCEIINVDFDSIDSSKRGWKDKYSWTVKQNKEFVSWLTKYMLAPDARKQLMTGLDRENVKQIKRKKFAVNFVALYGWKIEEKKI